MKLLLALVPLLLLQEVSAMAQTPPPLTPDQLKLVRAVAEREAGRLDIPEGQAGLLANAMIGVLTGPAA